MRPQQLKLFASSQPARAKTALRPPVQVSPPPPQPREPAVKRPRQDLLHRLQPLFGDKIHSLTLTQNRSRIVSARPNPKGLGLDVRIHHCFREASDEVLSAVAHFLMSRKKDRGRQQALLTIREHFQNHQPKSPAPQSSLTLNPQGQHHNLLTLRDRLNREYFTDDLEVAITWGRAPRVRRKRSRNFSILLGSYNEAQNLIRLHPCLDHPTVPEYVVESVVYHEMLHADLPTVVCNGRRRLHTPFFRQRERLYRHFEKAQQWIDQNLVQLAARR